MPKFCPNCGMEISDKVKFCEYCGVNINSFSVKKDSSSLPLIKCFFKDCPDNTSRRFYCPLCGHDFCEKHKLHQVHNFILQEKPSQPESKPVQPESEIPTGYRRNFKGINKSHFAAAFLIIAAILVLAFFISNLNNPKAGTVTTTPLPQTPIPTPITVPTVTLTPISTVLPIPIQQHATVATPYKTIYPIATSTRIAYPRPTTGTIISIYNWHQGEGELTIDNTAGSSDVVSSLTYQNSKTTLLAVFIRKGESYTINNIIDGTYDLFVLSGEEWDPITKQFYSNVGRIKFEDSLPYTTSNTDFTIWRVTLYPVIDGNAKTKPISQDDFPRL